MTDEKPLLSSPVDEALLDSVIAAQRAYAEAYEKGDLPAIKAAWEELTRLCPYYFLGSGTPRD